MDRHELAHRLADVEDALRNGPTITATGSTRVTIHPTRAKEYAEIIRETSAALHEGRERAFDEAVEAIKAACAFGDYRREELTPYGQARFDVMQTVIAAIHDLRPSNATVPQQQSQMKPCPFCGRALELDASGRRWDHPASDLCLLFDESEFFGVANNVRGISAWNRRAETPVGDATALLRAIDDAWREKDSNGVLWAKLPSATLQRIREALAA
jgi:hypothetical protein